MYFWCCEGIACGKEYVSKFGNGALKYIHCHLADPRCVGDLKETILKYDKEFGIM